MREEARKKKQSVNLEKNGLGCAHVHDRRPRRRQWRNRDKIGMKRVSGEWVEEGGGGLAENWIFDENEEEVGIRDNCVLVHRLFIRTTHENH